MSKTYTVTAMSGGRDKSFPCLEAARAYADELLGENDSLDIHIVNQDGVRFYTNPQLELIQSLSEQEEPARDQPQLSINLKIRISPQASEEQIETSSSVEEQRFRR